jgi:4-hydroxybenzoate polyprenyltransferase
MSQPIAKSETSMARGQARGALASWLTAMRLHQWAKHALVFVPLLLSGQAASLHAWALAAAGFLALGLMVSGTYLFNDLMDLDSDRQHWSKKNRPLAKGDLSVGSVMLAAPILIAAGISLAWATSGPAATLYLLTYLVATVAYSLGIKRVAFADVLLIAGLFTLRLLFGAILVQAPLKPWLFVFSAFLFTSLALTKRVSELQRLAHRGQVQAPGRAYRAADAMLLQNISVASGVASVLVMVLFLINEASVQPFYRLPDALFAAPAMLTLWLGRVWLLTSRGEMNDDPVLFALTDRTSLVLGAGLCLSLAAAMFL